MSAYKNFISSDFLITPINFKKKFTFQGGDTLTRTDVGINRMMGELNNSLFNPSSSLQTGDYQLEYANLVYKSIVNLYYSNYTTSSVGDEPYLYEVIDGATPEDDVKVGNKSSRGRFENYPQSTLTLPKYHPSSSIGVISIPSTLYGEYITPSTLSIVTSNVNVVDDLEGNLYESGSDVIIGNIIYPHGLILFSNWESGSVYDVITNPDITLSYSSSLTTYETEIKCNVNENEYNFSLNPSLRKNEEGDMLDFVTGSDFKPYVSTIGLYNDKKELLAVSKLSQPLPISNLIDTNFIINFDI